MKVFYTRLGFSLIFLVGGCATVAEEESLFSTFNLKKNKLEGHNNKNTRGGQERSLRQGEKSKGVTAAAKHRRQQARNKVVQRRQQRQQRAAQATNDDTTATTTTDICFDDIFQASAIGAYVMASFWHEVTQTQHCDASGIAAVFDRYFREDCAWYTQQGQVLATDLQSVKNVIIGNIETPGTIAYSCAHYHVTWATLDVVTEPNVNNDFVWIGQEIVTEPPPAPPAPAADSDITQRRRTLQQSQRQQQQQQDANITTGEMGAGLYSSTFRMYFIDMEGAHGSWRPQGYDDDDYGDDDYFASSSDRRSGKGPRYHHSHHQSKNSRLGGRGRRTIKGQDVATTTTTTTSTTTTVTIGPCTNPKIYGVVLLDEYPHPEFVGGS